MSNFLFWVVSHSRDMTVFQIHSDQVQVQPLLAIDGGRVHLERAAMDAVFSDTSLLPDILTQLAARPKTLRLVSPDGASA